MIEMQRVLTQKIAFVIAMRYVRGYPTYIEEYIGRVRRLYPGSTIILVDNNSINPGDICNTFLGSEDVIYIVNTTPCKFEIGAYKVGISYLNLYQEFAFDFVVFSQDLFLPNLQLDFDDLAERGIKACPVNTYYQDGYRDDIVSGTLNLIGLTSMPQRPVFCWCCTFIVAMDSLHELADYLNPIIITTRVESSASERYLGVILYEINNRMPASIDGDIRHLPYDCWKVDLLNDKPTSHFVKRVQQKTEATKDLD